MAETSSLVFGKKSVEMALLGEVICPKCNEPVRVYCDPNEGLKRSTPPKCPDCKVSLYDQVQARIAENARAANNAAG